MCYESKAQISTFIVEIDVFEEFKEMMDYNTVVIVNDFRKEMFLYSIGIYISILISNPNTNDFESS